MKKKIFSVLFLVLICICSNPVFAKEKKEAPQTDFQPDAIIDETETNPLYPKRYTPEYIKEIKPLYKKNAKDEIFWVALDILTGTVGEFSKNAILGNNLSTKPVKIQFKDLKTLNEAYDTFDAVGWKYGSKLTIFVSEKHRDAPAIAIAALLAHEALHQDEYNSLAEETYAWTMEAAVWTEMTEKYSDYEIPVGSLVQRENTLKKMFQQGNYTNKYIKKAVYSNEAYSNLPEISPGFEKL
ncbi:hypothetical protein IJ732_01055 [bacterium]|nr:hypothetical protein [bacterium]